MGRNHAWVSEATQGTIPHPVLRLVPADGLAPANAMRFKGERARRFDPEQAMPAPFHLRSGMGAEVPALPAYDLPAPYREDEGFQVAALPYGGGRFEFVTVPPLAGLEALRRLAADPSWC